QESLVLDEIDERGGKGVSQCASKRVHSPSKKEENKRQRTDEEDEGTDREMPLTATQEAIQEEPNLSGWASLPYKAGTAFDRISGFLRSEEDCPDLGNFSKVSTHFLNGVMEYMGRDGNLPGIEKLFVQRSGHGLEVECCLFTANIPFYDLRFLERRAWGRRVEREMRGGTPQLTVEVKSDEDDF
ncbi:hypothetical protein PMAYCL1PPCAC_27185, partial [Pristionchus mayeri]